jgi:hypothetical protein
MNLHLQTLIISELTRLESLNYVGLLGSKYLSDDVLSPDDEGNRVRAINLAPAEGCAIVVYGKPGEEQKHKFFRDIKGKWNYDGVEKIEAVH